MGKGRRARETGRAERREAAGHWLALAVVLLVTALTFGSIVSFEFTNWDDPANVAANPLVLSPTWGGLAQVWSGPTNNMYSPLVFTSFMLDTLVERGSAGVFHAVNLLLHLGSTTLVFFLLRMLPGVRWVWAAAAGALVFAVHPLQAESVAWVTGRKDVLCGFFALLAMVLHVRGWGGPRWYAVAATVAFALALLAKATVVALPVAVLALDVWLMKRCWRASAMRLLPWLAVAIVIGYIATRVQPMPDWLKDAVPVWRRPLLAAYALGFYLWKIVCPIGLAAVYTVNAPEAAVSAWSWVALVLITAIIVWALWKRGWAAAMVCLFVAPLLPVLGLVPFLYQHISLTADRYAYLSLWPVAMVVAWLVTRLPELRVERQRVAAGAVVAVLLVLAGLAFRQALTWRNSVTLWTHATRVSPGVPEAHTNLGYALHHEGKLVEAEAQLELAVKADPDFLMAWNLLGVLQLESKGAEAAIPALRESVRATEKRGYHDQRLAHALNNLGVALMDSGKKGEAARMFRRSIMIATSKEARENLAEVMGTEGQ